MVGSRGSLEPSVVLVETSPLALPTGLHSRGWCHSQSVTGSAGPRGSRASNGQSVSVSPICCTQKGFVIPRLVVNFSRLNQLISPYRFWMLIVTQVHLALSPGVWLTTLDLENAYWHIPIAKRFRKFLAVQVLYQTLQFTVLLFGLNLAPRVFTKMMLRVSTELSRRYVNSLMYLDDYSQTQI